jgi:hypothetical protein
MQLRNNRIVHPIAPPPPRRPLGSQGPRRPLGSILSPPVRSPLPPPPQPPGMPHRNNHFIRPIVSPPVRPPLPFPPQPPDSQRPRKRQRASNRGTQRRARGGPGVKKLRRASNALSVRSSLSSGGSPSSSVCSSGGASSSSVRSSGGAQGASSVRPSYLYGTTLTFHSSTLTKFWGRVFYFREHRARTAARSSLQVNDVLGGGPGGSSSGMALETLNCFPMLRSLEIQEADETFWLPAIRGMRLLTSLTIHKKLSLDLSKIGAHENDDTTQTSQMLVEKIKGDLDLCGKPHLRKLQVGIWTIDILRSEVAQRLRRCYPAAEILIL